MNHFYLPTIFPWGLRRKSMSYIFHLLPLTLFYPDLCSRWLTCRDILTAILAFCVWLDPANGDPSRGSEEGKNEAMVFIPSALSLWSCPRLSPLLKVTAFARWLSSHRPVVPLAPLASVVACFFRQTLQRILFSDPRVPPILYGFPYTPPTTLEIISLVNSFWLIPFKYCFISQWDSL